MPYSDNVWQKDARENIPPSACLIFFKKLKLRGSLSDLKRRLIKMWLGIQQSFTDQAIGEFALMHVLKPKESILNTCCDVLSHNYQ